MNHKMRRILAIVMTLVLLFGNTNVAFAARPGQGESDVYDHIDVRQEGPSITMTYVTKNLVTGEVLNTRTVTINCTVTAITSVSYRDASGYSNTWTSGFSNDGSGYEFRQMGLSLSKDLTGSYATIVVDLTDTNGNVYEDVVFTFGPDGCQQAVYDCDGYSSSDNGRGSVGLDFILGVNNTGSVTYTDWVIPVTKIWNDDGDRDGIRPESVTVELLANGTVVDSVVLSEANNWYHEFTDKEAADASGNPITYTIQETPVPDGYTASVDNVNFTVTNTHVLETTSVSGGKTWVDNDDQDGMRPDSITVELYANGEPTGKTATVTADDNWSWTFTDLLLNANGEPIVYTVVESPVEGYEATYDGMNVTNTHNPIKIEITVTKLWDDADNQDGIRPESITVELYANGEPTGNTITITGEEWVGTFTDLDMYANGEEIVYTVVEQSVDGYEAQVDGLTITNVHIPEVTEVSGSKTWNDADNQDGIRPESITINLLKGGEVIDTVTATAENGWAWSFTELPKYENEGTLIAYAISEEAVPGYTTVVDGYNITNTHTPEKTSVTVNKIWDDADNQDGLRPVSITVKLLADGVDTGKTLTISGESWTGTFADLDKYANGAEIEYTVVEVEVAGYTASYSADTLTITNSHTPAVVSVSGIKTWNDNENQDGVRPASITVKLLADGVVIDSVEVSEATGWAWSFDNLPKFSAGVQIKYSVTEVAVDGYTPSYDGYNITNTHTPEKTAVTVSKVWDDAQNQDGIRPNDVTIVLLANGVDTGKSVLLSDGNNWTGLFSDLDVYENGVAIEYTVAELTVEGYTTVVDGDQANGYTVTNTHAPATVEISGSKTWVDNDNQDGKRPESITINLLKNGEIIDSVEVSEATGWAWSFTDLPKYENQGSEITYTISEAPVDEYVTTYNGYNVTNTHSPEKTAVTVTKSWQDNNDQDGIRPNDITVVLLANGEPTGKILVLSDAVNWTGTFEDLDRYANGEVIAYSVEELNVSGYTTVITGDQASGYTITNSHNPEVVEVSGSKNWVDADDQDGKRPESITIHLLKNGEVIETITVTEADGWAWSFVGLPKYENHGTLITYSITEEGVEDYTTTYNGYNVTNTHTPEQTSVTVTKSWKDNNNQDGIRPNDITVELLANGEATGKTLVLNDGNSWTGSFTELDKYLDGEVITYTVAELAVEGYATVISGNQTTGYTITNSHTPATVEVSGTKTWKDNDDQDGARPESITIHLLKNGEIIDTITVTEADGWAWSFTNLPKYENKGTLITYSITEDVVEDYSTTYNGYNVTNAHTPEQTSVTVSKAWVDSNNQDGIRPNDITVVLLANGEETGKSLVLNEGNNWTGSFIELDKYASGEVIAYTVAEVSVEGYSTVITGDQNTGYTVTNTHTPEVVEVAGAKTWVDADNQDGFRPESITINLLADGVVIDTITVTEEDDWAWSFVGLPKYENHGTLITYSITEEAVEDYTTTYNGYNVTNTHTPEQTSVTVTKAWADSDDQDGIRPNDITVILLANGEETEYTLTLNEGNNWTDSFTGLDKYENGEIIVYTVTELEVKDYTAVITGDQTSGYTITNSHTPETLSFCGEKIWDDNDNQDGFRPESITINLLANGKIVDSIVVTEEDNWQWMFENLPKYENHGSLIYYSITENAVDGYSTIYEGFNVVNVHTPEEISLSVSKAWVDNNDQDGIRPDAIVVYLLADGVYTGETLVLDAESNWTGSFVGLDKYADGVEIEYTIYEVSVEGYETVITGDMTTGYIITNSHTPEVTEVSGTKTWDDGDNQDGVRPESITVNLLANGQVINTITVTEAENWSYSFTNLPKYENGVEIVYAITENAVDGYSTTYDGYNIINSYTPAEVSLTVTKAWADSDDEDGLRPKKITITLYANGELTDETLVLTADDNWTGSFVGLPKYAGGTEIVYTIGEIAVEGYNTVIRGDMVSGFVVTNSHTVIPQTGDERTPVMWMLMMFASVAVVAYVAYDSKKKRIIN